GIDSFVIGSSTPKFIVKDTGFIGLGTSTPAYKLTVNSESATQNFFQVASSTNQGIFVITNDGKVGIGTTSPSQSLSVAGTIYSGSGGFKFPDGSIQAAAMGFIVLNKTADYTLTAADANGNTLITNKGTAANRIFTLPTATVGYKVMIKVSEYNGANPYGYQNTINRVGTDTITVGATTGLPSLTSSVVGSIWELHSEETGKWIASLKGVQPSFEATSIADQDPTDNTDTLMIIADEKDDNNNNYDNSSGNYKFLPTIPGRYEITSVHRMYSAANTTNYLKIFKNGSEYKQMRWDDDVTGGSEMQFIIVEYNANGSDWFQSYVYLAAGSVVANSVGIGSFKAKRVSD
ncbi:MAG: hypothetical protein AAB564_02850, partial [Patescibacteria group bacterium]